MYIHLLPKQIADMCRSGPGKAAVAKVREHHSVGYHCRHVQLQARGCCTHMAATTAATATAAAIAANTVTAVAAATATATASAAASVVIAAQQASQEQVGFKRPPLAPHHERSWQAQAEDFAPP